MEVRFGEEVVVLKGRGEGERVEKGRGCGVDRGPLLLLLLLLLLLACTSDVSALDKDEGTDWCPRKREEAVVLLTSLRVCSSRCCFAWLMHAGQCNAALLLAEDAAATACMRM